MRVFKKGLMALLIAGSTVVAQNQQPGNKPHGQPGGHPQQGGHLQQGGQSGIHRMIQGLPHVNMQAQPRGQFNQIGPQGALQPTNWWQSQLGWVAPLYPPVRGSAWLPPAFYPPQPVSTAYVPNLNGTWFLSGDPGKPARIVQWRFDGRALFVNEKGSQAWGTIQGDTVWIPDWSDGYRQGLLGTLRRDRIIWPDGNFWSRTPAGPGPWNW